MLTRMMNPSQIIFDNIGKNENILSLQEWIIECKGFANVEAKHPQYSVPLLYFACIKKNVEAVKILLENKANINAQTSPNGSTALHIASHQGFGKLTKLLL